MKLKQILLTALLSVSVTTISADVITTTSSFDTAYSFERTLTGLQSNLARNYSNSSGLQISQFDDALGTLNSVALTFQSSISRETHGITRDTIDSGSTDDHSNCGFFENCTETQFDAYTSTGYDVDFFGLGLSRSTSSFTRILCQDAKDDSVIRDDPVSQCSDSFGFSFGYDFSEIFTGASLSNFIGLGTLVGTAFAETSLTGFCSADSGEFCNVAGDVDWSGQLSVTYDFTAAPPVPVPAPTSAALFALMLLGLGIKKGQKH